MKTQKTEPMTAQTKRQTIIRIVIIAVLTLATAALFIWLVELYGSGSADAVENTRFGVLKLLSLKTIAYGLLTLTLIALFELFASLSSAFLRLSPVFAAIFGIVDAAIVFFYNNLLHMLKWNIMFSASADDLAPTPYSYFLRYDLNYRYGLSIFRYILLFVIVVLACLLICAIRSGWFRRIFHKAKDTNVNNAKADADVNNVKADAASNNVKALAVILSVFVLTASLSACRPAPTLDEFLAKYENTSIDVLRTDAGEFLRGLLKQRDTVTKADFASWKDRGSMEDTTLYYKELTLFGVPTRIDAYGYEDVAKGATLYFKYELDNKTNIDIGVELCNRSIELLGPPDGITVNTADPDSKATLDEYRRAVADGTAKIITMTWSRIWIFADESQVSWFIVRAPQTQNGDQA